MSSDLPLPEGIQDMKDAVFLEIENQEEMFGRRLSALEVRDMFGIEIKNIQDAVDAHQEQVIEQKEFLRQASEIKIEGDVPPFSGEMQGIVRPQPPAGLGPGQEQGEIASPPPERIEGELASPPPERIESSSERKIQDARVRDIERKRTERRIVERDQMMLDRVLGGLVGHNIDFGLDQENMSPFARDLERQRAETQRIADEEAAILARRRRPQRLPRPRRQPPPTGGRSPR